MLFSSVNSSGQLIAYEGQKITLDIKAEDPDNDSLSYIYSHPFDENGSWTPSYTSAGKINATINVSDSHNMVSQVFEILVQDMEAIPDLSYIPSRITAKEGETLLLNLPKFDPDGDLITYEGDSQLEKTGIWDIAFNQSGPYSVNIKATDAKGNEVSKIISIIVEDKAIDLQLSQTTFTIEEGSTLTIPLPAFPGISAEYKIIRGPKSIQLSNNSIIYTPEFSTVSSNSLISRIQHQFSKSNADIKSISIPVIIRLEEESKNIHTLSLNIIVTDKNLAPQLEVPETISLSENEITRITPQVSDPDGDPVTLTYSGYFNSPLIRTQSGDSGIHTMLISASDGISTTYKEVEITVEKLNHLPELKSKRFAIWEMNNQPINIKVEDKDQDPVTIKATNVPSEFSIQDSTVSWSPDYDTITHPTSALGNFYFSLGLPLFKTYKIPVQVSDSKVTILDTITITVLDSNREPMATSTNITEQEGNILNIPKTGFDFDSDPLTYKFSDIGRFDQKQIPYNKAGNQSYKMIVSDGPSEISLEGSINVINTNRPPTLKVIDRTVYEDSTIFIDLQGKDPDGDNVTYEIISAPSGVILGENKIIYTPSLSTTNAQEKQKEFEIIIRTSDGDLSTDSSFKIRVLNTNRLPQIIATTPQDNFATDSPTTVRFTVSAIDPDNDPLTYTWHPDVLTAMEGTNTHIRKLLSPGIKSMKVVVSDGQDSTSYTWQYKVR